MKAEELCKELNRVLEIADYNMDISLNGVQVACSPNKEIRKVALAVDACQATIDAAVKEGADMLFVHHGLFWGKPLAIDGTHYNRVKKLLDNDVMLFACHLPLDGHPALGNNAQMAISLGMKSYDMFSEYHGKKIGVKGTLPFPMSCEEIARLLGFSPEWGLTILPFGKEEISTVGIVSGGGGYDVTDAISEKLDCYITGTAPHEIYHTCLEEGMNFISGGHYQSEVFGVRAVGRMLKAEYDIDSIFIDRRTAL